MHVTICKGLSSSWSFFTVQPTGDRPSEIEANKQVHAIIRLDSVGAR